MATIVIQVIFYLYDVELSVLESAIRVFSCTYRILSGMFYLLRRSLFLQSAFGVYTLDVFYFYDIQSEWFVLSVLQSAIRGYFGRMLFKQELHEHRAITIQKMVRSYLARRRYKRVMRGIVLLQSHYRRRRAKKQLKVLKVCHTFVCIYIAGLSYILDIFCILIKLASLLILD